MAAPFEEWYMSVPPVTRTFITGCFVVTCASMVGLVNTLQLYFHVPNILNFEIWRIFTNFFFFDKTLGISFLFHMYFLYRHSRMLEETTFHRRTADFVFLWLFGAVFLIIIDFALYYTPYMKSFTLPFLGPSLTFMVVYIWSRNNPHVIMSFLGLFTFPAPYLPWVILGFGTLLGQNPIYDLFGLVVGHIYAYLEFVLPETAGIRLLSTPSLLCVLNVHFVTYPKKNFLKRKHFLDPQQPQNQTRE